VVDTARAGFEFVYHRPSNKLPGSTQAAGGQLTF
jgi:hypothetical protein